MTNGKPSLIMQRNNRHTPKKDGKNQKFDCSLARGAANASAACGKELLTIMGGNMLVVMNLGRIEFLAIDHMNGAGAQHRRSIGKGGTVLYGWASSSGNTSLKGSRFCATIVIVLWAFMAIAHIRESLITHNPNPPISTRRR
jgi:hypothetical protein